MRRRGVRLVAVSSYTAGALIARGPATILPPGLSGRWFGTLVAAADEAGAADRPTAGPRLEVMTAFRLDDWRGKGLPELVDAIAQARPAGHQADRLRQRRARRPGCSLT